MNDGLVTAKPEFTIRLRDKAIVAVEVSMIATVSPVLFIVNLKMDFY